MKALVICPVVAFFKMNGDLAEFKGQIVIPDAEIPDTMIGGSSGNSGFRKLVPVEELPPKLFSEIQDAGYEFATGNCGFTVSTIAVELCAGSQSVSARLSNADDRMEVDEALHDVLFEFMSNNMEIEFGLPEVLISNRGFITKRL